MSTSPVNSMFNVLEAVASSADIKNSEVIGSAYENVRTWLDRRYGDIDLSYLDEALLSSDSTSTDSSSVASISTGVAANGTAKSMPTTNGTTKSKAKSSAEPKSIQAQGAKTRGSATKSGLSKRKRNSLLKKMTAQGAEMDIELLNRIMDLQQQVIHAPNETISNLGVNLENVEAENITIKDIYVGLPKPAEAPGFHCVMAYLEQVCKAKSLGPTRFDSNGSSPEKLRLADIPVHLRRTGGDLTYRIPVGDAVHSSFAKDRRIERIQRVVLLGDAGSGKTDALFQLRKQVAQRSLDTPFSFDEEGRMVVQTEDGPVDAAAEFVVPIYINLGDLYNGSSLPVLIRDEFNRHFDVAATQLEISTEQVPKLLKSYTCLLLLDSLDTQVSNRTRLEEIRSFMENNSQEQYVITCRRGTYGDQLGALDVLIVDDLTEEEAKGILSQRRYDVLSLSLKQLAHNRLMLRILLDLETKERRPANSLENKGQLIQLLTEERLRRALADDLDGKLNEDLADSLLEHIAYRMYSDHKHRYTERELMTVVKAYLDEWNEPYHWREITQMLVQIGMITRAGKRRWQFRDRVTAAYFAASAMVNEPARLGPALAEVSDLWWRDVFELLAGLTHNPTKLFFDVMDLDILTTAHVARFRDLSDPVYDAIIDTLIERMSHEHTLERRRIAAYLGESGHDRAAEALIHALHQEKASNVVLTIARAVWQWTTLNQSGGDVKSAENAVMQRSTTQLESFAELLQEFDQLTKTKDEGRQSLVDKLMKRLKNKKESKLCRGLCAIGLGFAPSDETVDVLFELAMNETEEPFVAWCAVDSLTQWRVPQLEQKAVRVFNEIRTLSEENTKASASQSDGQTAEEDERRVRATYLLGWVCSGTSTRHLLRDRAMKDENPAVRGYAVDSLLQLDLPDARDHIEKLLATEEHPTVIRKCAEALNQVGTVSSLPALERHLYNEHARTRWTLRKAVNDIRQRNGLG